jgi:hypothetical protein
MARGATTAVRIKHLRAVMDCWKKVILERNELKRWIADREFRER